MKSLLLLALGGLLISFVSPTLAVEVDPLERTTHGRFEALRWTNGTVDLVVVPATGRIVRYGFVDDANVLWENIEPEARDHRIGGWVNWGGDKIWIWPQGKWNEHFGRGWPPPMDNLKEPYEVSFKDNRLTMRSPAISKHALRVVRQIELASSGTKVSLRTHLENAAALPGAVSWQVTQMPVPDQMIARPAPDAKQATPYKHDGMGAWPASRLEEGLLSLDRSTVAAKAGLEADRLAARFGRTLFVQTVRDATPGATHRPGEGAQVYHEPNLLGKTVRPAGEYVEFEFTAPRLDGAATDLTIEWTLHRLPSDTTAEPAIRQHVREP